MLKHPPLFSTYRNPEDIIGSSNMDLFKKFYSIASSSTNAGEYPEKRLNKEFSKQDRKAIGETLQELRNFGFYPIGMLATGKIKWGIATKSQSQIEFEKGLDELVGLPEKQLIERARSGYLKAIKNATVDQMSDGEQIYAEVTG